ncbi:MAG: zinc metallopeptidase [Saprospiraceae bacterium]|nr:zinc metallopeptidase [Saprospiraceae bacterium]
MIYYILVIALSLVGMWVSGRLQSKFKAYSKVGLRANRSGREIAADMLQYYGLHNVRVLESDGFLSDHYNPVNRTVNLSPEVFHGRSVAAAAVAAHECGHAVQHDTAYSMLQLRSKLVPVVKFASVAQQYLLLAAFMLANTFPSLMLVTIILFAITTLFSIITLPVEFDASKRALVWIDKRGVVTSEEYAGAKDSLTWAGMTYVAAALSSLVMLVYLILRYVGANRE